jgi:very-short-patch-repair endonuclease
VEVDGYAYHRHRKAFESDRRRDQELVAAGYRVIRVTWLQLRDQPISVITSIAQALARTP